VTSLDVQPLTRPPGHHFFGYYDNCPWNSDGSLVLCLEAGGADRPPRTGEPATVGVIRASDGHLTAVARTGAWNLQQGAMVQWLGPAFSDQIIYNDFRDGRYVGLIRNLDPAHERVLSRPVYSVSADGRQALSLDFSRLHRLRPGYGYLNVPDRGMGQERPTDSGVWHIDLRADEASLVLSIEQIAAYRPDDSMAGVDHWVNHLEFNPSGTRFMFLHRWTVDGKRRTRLFTANPDGSELFCVTDHEVVSHCAWRSDDEILAWANRHESGLGYYLFRDRTGEFSPVGAGQLTEDGHPSYSPDRRWILTDTYPDRARMQTLILYDTWNERRVELGRFLSPIRYYGEARCDLHPRWNRDGTKVCFDSAHSGTRQMYVVDVSDIVGS
jgi:hypothetical protein